MFFMCLMLCVCFVAVFCFLKFLQCLCFFICCYNVFEVCDVSYAFADFVCFVLCF